MSSASSAPQGTSLPYSASSPLPMSHQPTSLPSSLTQPTQPSLGLLVALPEPLLPLSSVSNDGLQGVQNNPNPFLWGPIKLENCRNKRDVSRELSSSILLSKKCSCSHKDIKQTYSWLIYTCSNPETVTSWVCLSHKKSCSLRVQRKLEDCIRNQQTFIEFCHLIILKWGKCIT